MSSTKQTRINLGDGGVITINSDTPIIKLTAIFEREATTVLLSQDDVAELIEVLTAVYEL